MQTDSNKITTLCIIWLFILHVDTSEVSVSDPETPEDERKDVFGGDLSCKYSQSVQLIIMIVANDTYFIQR